MLIASLLQAAMASPGSPGAAIPLYVLDETCEDSRYPALAGPWVVACGSDGRVDRALSLESGRLLMLPAAHVSPGLAAGWVYVPGRRGGLISLSESGAERVRGLPSIHEVPVAPPAVDGERVAMLSEGHIQAALVTDAARRLHEVQPAGWYPPALAEGHVAWVGQGEGEDVWWMALPDGEPELL